MKDNSIYKNGWCYCDLNNDTEQKCIELLSEVKKLFLLTPEIKNQFAGNSENPHEGWRLPNDINRPSEVWQIRANTYKKWLPLEFHNIGKISFEIIDNILAKYELTFIEAFEKSNLNPFDLFQSIKRGLITVRFLYYKNSHNKYSFNEHTDFGIASVFLCQSQPGLELKNDTGVWTKVELPSSQCILAFGDMLEFLSNNKIPAGIHRVSKTHHDRFSIAFFLQPEDDFLISNTSENIRYSKDFFEAKFREMMNKK